MATINTHTSKTGITTFRVRVQRKGQKVLTSTHKTLKDARKWATMIEGEIIAGKHFPTKSKRTLSELLDRYTADVMPRKSPESQRVQGYVLAYWKRTLGHMLLDDIQPHHIITARNAIANPIPALEVQPLLTHVTMPTLRPPSHTLAPFDRPPGS